MKKMWLGFMAAVALTSGVVAHVVAQDTATPSGVVRVGSWESGEALEPWDNAIASFEAQYPEIDVQLEAVPQEYGTRLLAQFASGNAPDIFMTGDGDTAKFQALGAVEPLDPYINGENGLDLSVYLPGLAEFGQVGGETYYLTKDYSPLVLYYNAEQFAEAGVEAPTADWTWDDFVTAAQTLTIDANGNNALSPDFDASNIQRWGVQLPNDWGDIAWLRGILPVIYANGGSVISEDGTTAEGYMNSAETVAALQQFVDLFATLHVAPNAEDVAAYTGVNLFQSGLVSMLWNGSWPLAGFIAEPPFEFGTAGMPAGSAGNANVLCWSGFAMYSGSQNKDAAWEFLKFISAGEGAEAFADNALTAVQSVADERGLVDDPYYGPVIADLANVKPLPESASPFWAECGNTAFVNQMQRVLIEGITVQEAMDTAAAETDSCLADAAAS